MDPKTKAAKLISFLKENGLTQKKVSGKTGYKEAYVSKLKKGRIQELTTYEAFIQDILAAYPGIEWDETKGSFQFRADPAFPGQPAGPSLPVLNWHPKCPPFQELFEEVRQNKLKRFQILDTWITDLNDDREKLFWDGAKELDTLRILILHPDSPALLYRSAALSYTIDQARNHIFKNLESIFKFQKALKGRTQVEFRLYDDLPGLNILAHEKKIYYSGFLTTGYSQNSFFHEASNDGKLISECLNQHFKNIWERSSAEISREEFEALKKSKYAPKLYPNSSSAVFDKFKGRYAIYNLDEGPEIRFQVTCLDIDPDTRRCTLSYNARNSSQIVRTPVNVELLDERKLLISSKQDQFLIFMLASAGKNQDPELLQAIYLHADSRDFPRSGFCILERTDEEVIPLRLDSNAPEIAPRFKAFLTNPHPKALQIDRPAYSPNDLGVAPDTLSEFPFQGVFRVYSYGRKTDSLTKCIVLSKLQIFASGATRFEGFRPDFLAEGKAFTNESSLHIQLQNINSKRLGYFILTVEQTLPGPNIIFAGIFTGVSISENLPVSYRVILEYRQEGYEDLPTGRVSLFSEEFEALPEGIRQTLGGRIPNFITFSEGGGRLFSFERLKRAATQKLDYGRVFMESAAFKLLKPNPSPEDARDALRMAIRAINHGFTALAEFEALVSRAPHAGTVLQAPEYLRLRKMVLR